MVAHRVGGNRKRYQQSPNADQKSILTVFDCHLSPDWRQMAIKNSVSNIFLSTLLDSIAVFNCCLPGVWLETNEKKQTNSLVCMLKCSVKNVKQFYCPS